MKTSERIIYEEYHKEFLKKYYGEGCLGWGTPKDEYMFGPLWREFAKAGDMDK